MALTVGIADVTAVTADAEDAAAVFRTRGAEFNLCDDAGPAANFSLREGPPFATAAASASRDFAARDRVEEAGRVPVDFRWRAGATMTVCRRRGFADDLADAEVNAEFDDGADDLVEVEVDNAAGSCA